MAPSSVRTAHSVLRSLFATAVKDERIARNPAARAELPKVHRARDDPLSADEIAALVRHAPPDLRAAVVLAAGTGSSSGEAMAVSADRIDWLRTRSLRCDRQGWTPRRGPSSSAVPKSPRSTRTIALSDTVLAALAAHVKTYGTGRHRLGFHHGEDGFWSRDLLAKQIKRRQLELGSPGSRGTRSGTLTPRCCCRPV